MKLATLTLLGLLSISNAASARGGAIGGGEVNKYPLFSCSAEGIDPTFPTSISTLVVHGEADYEGFIMPDISVTIELTDINGDAVAYLPTKTLPHDFHPAKLEAYQYHAAPGENVPVIAEMQVYGSNGSLIPASFTSGVEELVLTNCEYIAVAQSLPRK